MMMNKITGIKVAVGKNPEVVEVDAGLESMQSIVGGYIERVAFHSKIDLWINEEGLLIDLPHNFITVVVDDGLPRPVHEIVGDVIFFSHDEEGNTVSLTEVQANMIMDMFTFNRKWCIVR